MTKVAIAALTSVGLTALLISTASPVHAQPSPTTGAAQGLSRLAEMKAFTDRRIDVVKAALQLTPAQAKYWPAVEEAIRARANARYARLAKLAAEQSEDRERSPIDLIQQRADNLAQRASGLKRLGDAWQPLYQSLDTTQQVRLRFLALYVMRELRNARDQEEEE